MQFQPDWGAVPAWVQAIGSIVAIIVAIWVSWKSDKRARTLVEDERERVTAIARSYLLHVFKRIEWSFKTHSDTIRKYAFQATIKDIPNLYHIMCVDQIDSALTRNFEISQLTPHEANCINDAFDTFDFYKKDVESFIRYLQAQQDPNMHYANPSAHRDSSIDSVTQMCGKAILCLSSDTAGV